MRGIKRIFKKYKKNFQKPLDKSKLYAIIKLQRERNQQKIFGDFKSEIKRGRSDGQLNLKPAVSAKCHRDVANEKRKGGYEKR